MTKKSFNQAGITFIEILIAVLILGILFAAVLGAFVMGKVSVTKAKHYTQAISLARQKMEEIKGMSYSQISSLQADSPITEDEDDNFVLDPGSGSLDEERETQIEDDDSGKKITVTVSWREHSLGSDNEVSVDVVTLVSEH